MWTTIVLLVLSNVFMTFAWYGHLRFKSSGLFIVILVSWGIAFFEYCLQVPANRIGHNSGLTAAELKTIQEVITLSVFIVFVLWYLREPVTWNVIVGFLLIALGATFVFEPWKAETLRVFKKDAEHPGLVERHGATGPDEGAQS